MPAEARISSTWKFQKLIIGLLITAGSLPFFWDGAVGYERKNQRYREWKRFADEHRESEWPDEAARRGWNADEWPDYIRDHSLFDHLPAEPFPPGKIIEQYVCAGVALLFGSIILGYWMSQKGRIIRTDDDAVMTPAGTRVPFSAITGVGKKQWESKGIARVRYELDGKRGQFVVDDYKFDTEPSRTILKEIEEKLVAKTGGAAAAKAAPGGEV